MLSAAVWEVDGSDASNSGADLVDLGHGAGKKTGLLIRHGAGNALEYILGIYLTWRGRIYVTIRQRASTKYIFGCWLKLYSLVIHTPR